MFMVNLRRCWQLARLCLKGSQQKLKVSRLDLLLLLLLPPSRVTSLSVYTFIILSSSFFILFLQSVKGREQSLVKLMVKEESARVRRGTAWVCSVPALTNYSVGGISVCCRPTFGPFCREMFQRSLTLIEDDYSASVQLGSVWP